MSLTHARTRAQRHSEAMSCSILAEFYKMNLSICDHIYRTNLAHAWLNEMMSWYHLQTYHFLCQAFVHLFLHLFLSKYHLHKAPGGTSLHIFDLHSIRCNSVAILGNACVCSFNSCKVVLTLLVSSSKCAFTCPKFSNVYDLRVLD